MIIIILEIAVFHYTSLTLKGLCGRLWKTLRKGRKCLLPAFCYSLFSTPTKYKLCHFFYQFKLHFPKYIVLFFFFYLDKSYVCSSVMELSPMASNGHNEIVSSTFQIKIRLDTTFILVINGSMLIHNIRVKTDLPNV